MTDRYRAGVVPTEAGESPLEAAAAETIAAYTRAMDAYDLQQGAALLIELATRANRYVEETTPWKLAKAKRDGELDQVLAHLVRTVARLAVLSGPFIPVKAEEIWTSLGADRSLASLRLADLTGLAVAGWKVSKPPPLFPKPDAD